MTLYWLNSVVILFTGKTLVTYLVNENNQLYVQIKFNSFLKLMMQIAKQ